ncbi:MAG: hypothetical protein JNK12_14960 [Acidimicrobiales bacterium]|nr:hypothetical protein [Acidimicrobiales bacterium]
MAAPPTALTAPTVLTSATLPPPPSSTPPPPPSAPPPSRSSSQRPDGPPPTPPPPAPAGPEGGGAGRLGALLVAGTGAFLLFAAAVVFVAVRWGHLPESAKVAIVGGLTASLLVAGRVGRRALPGTATALFHLGAFLVPVDVAALLVRGGAPTDVVLLVTGLAAVGALGLGARLERSPVLAAGGVVGTVVAATGLGLLAGGPVAPVVLPGLVTTAWCTAGAIGAARRSDWVAEAALPLALLAVLTPAGCAAAIAGDVPTPLLLSVLLALAWGLGAALDHTESNQVPALGALPRVASALLLAPAVDELTPAGDGTFTAAFAAVMCTLAVVEAARLRQPALAALAAVAAPVSVVAGALAAGAVPSAAGLVSLGVALVPLAIATVAPRPWPVPAVLTAATLAGTGLVLAAGQPSTGATALLLTGGLLLLAGALWGLVPVAVLGGVTASVGYWSHLDQRGIEAADALVLPVVVALAVVGLVAERHRAASSWFTLAPPLALLGGTAVAERLDGGSGIHGLVAGAVGVVAVVVGGRLRLTGPLVVGLVLLGVLTVFETLAVTAGVPTWAWLAAGGSVLLGAGVALDRTDTGPVEAGRHLRDVLDASFR